jgi:hypothetical protein
MKHYFFINLMLKVEIDNKINSYDQDNYTKSKLEKKYKAKFSNE